MKKLTLEEIKLKLFKINPNLTIISREYINARTPLDVKCNKCGHISSKSWNTLSQGRECELCGKYKKRTLDSFKSELKEINPNIKILSKEYIKASEKLQCECLIDGYKWSATPNNLLKGYGCMECYLKSKHLPSKVFYEKCKDNNPDYIVLSEFISTCEKVKCKCRIHNCEFETQARSIMNGKKSCPMCISESMSGKNNVRYTGLSNLSDYLRRFIKEWKLATLEFYKYKCFITNSTENLQVHHLYPFKKILEEALFNLKLPIYENIDLYTQQEINELITETRRLHNYYGLGVVLTQEEHLKFHSKYGFENTTKEQFNDYFNIRINQISPTTIETVA